MHKPWLATAMLYKQQAADKLKYLTRYTVTGSQWVDINHTARNMQTVRAWLCFVVLHRRPSLPISSMVTSLTLGQSCDCPSVRAATPNTIVK